MDKTHANSLAAAAVRSARTVFERNFKTAPKSNPAGDPAEDPTEESIEKSWDEIRKSSKYKLRSLETSRDEHLPNVLGASQAISAVLLGDSMIERMTTTGKTRSLQLWPSETMWPEGNLEDTNLRRRALHLPQFVRISGMLNAGCGGDKIENIIYRLVGDPERGLTGLAEALLSPKRKGKVRLWVVHAGTNNLHPKKGLTDESVQAFRVLLETILDISDESTHILVTGLFYRRDIKNGLVEEANAKLKKLVHELVLEDSPDYAKPEQQPAEGSISRFDFATNTAAPQATDVKGKGKAVEPEDRRDSAFSNIMTPVVTHEKVDIKGKGKAMEAPPGTQEPVVGEKTRGPPLTDSDPTMPQFKPNWWPSVFRKDPEAVGKPRGIKPSTRPSTRPETTWRPPASWMSGYREADPDYPRIQFLPPPGANDPETWLEDHVHLHEEGYRFWMRKLFPKVKEMLSHAEEAAP